MKHHIKYVLAILLLYPAAYAGNIFNVAPDSKTIYTDKLRLTISDIYRSKMDREIRVFNTQPNIFDIGERNIVYWSTTSQHNIVTVIDDATYYVKLQASTAIITLPEVNIDTLTVNYNAYVAGQFDTDSCATMSSACVQSDLSAVRIHASGSITGSSITSQGAIKATNGYFSSGVTASSVTVNGRLTTTGNVGIITTSTWRNALEVAGAAYSSNQDRGISVSATSGGTSMWEGRFNIKSNSGETPRLGIDWINRAAYDILDSSAEIITFRQTGGVGKVSIGYPYGLDGALTATLSVYGHGAFSTLQSSGTLSVGTGTLYTSGLGNDFLSAYGNGGATIKSNSNPAFIRVWRESGNASFWLYGSNYLDIFPRNETTGAYVANTLTISTAGTVGIGIAATSQNDSEKLYVNGNTTISGTQQVAGSATFDSSVTASSITSQNDLSVVRIHASGAITVSSFTASGDGAFNSNLYFGGTLAKGGVVGESDIDIRSTGYQVGATDMYQHMQFMRNSGDNDGIVFGHLGTGGGFIGARTAATGQGLSFWTFDGAAWAARLQIAKSGNTGINDTTPDALLEVLSNASPTVYSLLVSSQNDSTVLFGVQGDGHVVENKTHLVLTLSADQVTPTGSTATMKLETLSSGSDRWGEFIISSASANAFRFTAAHSGMFRVTICWGGTATTNAYKSFAVTGDFGTMSGYGRRFTEGAVGGIHSATAVFEGAITAGQYFFIGITNGDGVNALTTYSTTQWTTVIIDEL